MRIFRRGQLDSSISKSRRFASPSYALAGLFLVLTALSAHATHVYWWHGNSLLDGSNFNRSSNWTDGQNGGGPWPTSSKDDDFSTLNTAVWSFLNQDNNGSTGNPTVSGGELVIAASGADNWSWVREFVAAYRADITGAFDVTTKIVSQTNTNSWAKAGLIMANSFTDINNGGYAIVAATPQGHGVAFQWASDPNNPGRLNNNASTEVAINFPVWVRMVKSGGQVRAFYKEDKWDTWTQIGSAQTLPGTAANSQIGLFATSHNTSAISTAKFDEWQTSADIVQEDLTFRFNGTGSNADWESYMSEDFTLKEIDFTDYTGNFRFQSYKLSVTGNFTNSTGYTVDEGTGSIEFTGSGTQVFIPRSNSEMVPIKHTGGGTLKLSNHDLITKSFEQTAGTLDMNGYNISVTSGGGFSIENGTSTTIVGLGGRTLSAEGNISLSGTSGNKLNLNPASSWNVNAGGSLTATYADIKLSNANGSQGFATNSTDQGGNNNWSFEAGEDLSQWAESIPIEIDAQGITTSNLSNFPVLVRLHGNNFPFHRAASDGSDIRFSLGGTSPLAYEIESWNAGGDDPTAAVWVKVPNVQGGGKTQITMHWGKPGAESKSNGEAVFNNAYAAVWHMNTDPSQGVPDATAHQQTGAAVGMSANNLVDAVAGKGYNFDGTEDYINLGTMNQNFSGGATLCGWMKYDAFNNWSRLADIGNGANTDNILIANQGTTDDARFKIFSSGTGTVDVPDFFILNTWKYVCGTVDDSDAEGNMKLYRHGEEVGAATGTAPANVARTKSYIAKSNWSADALYNGKMDEVRFSTVARSADWINLSYETQKPGADVVTLKQEYYFAWNHHRNLVINTSATGMNVQGTVQNFPLLVRLSRLNFAFSEAKIDGGDLRFSRQDGEKPLSFEIEYWDAAAGEAAIWVKVPEIQGNNDTQYIRMHWGNSSAVPQSAPGDVFSGSNGFKAVWHMEDASFSDAVGGFNGTGVNLDASNIVPGVMGKAVSLNGVDEYIDIQNSVTGALNLPLNGTYTLSAWVKPNVLDGKDRPILMKGDHQYALKIKSNDKWEFVHKTSTTWEVLQAAAAAGEWVHLVGVQNGSEMKMYVNGEETGTPLVVQNGPRDESHPVHIGHNAEVSTRYFAGLIDEVRIMEGARSPEWVKMSYETERDGGVVLDPGGILDLVEIRRNLAKDYNGSEISVVVPAGVIKDGDHFLELTSKKELKLRP